MQPAERQAEQLLRWNASDKKLYRVVAKASSHHPKHPVKYLLDGDPATAWCEGVPSMGVGESVRFWFDTTTIPCQLYGVAVTHGYLKSQKTYLENGRVTKFSLTDCQGVRSYLGSTAVELQSWYRHGASDYKFPDDIQFAKNLGKVCLQLTITDVANGQKYQDTCLSEVTFLSECG